MSALKESIPVLCAKMKDEGVFRGPDYAKSTKIVMPRLLSLWTFDMAVAISADEGRGPRPIRLPVPKLE
jgi:hypothetical protein